MAKNKIGPDGPDWSLSFRQAQWAAVDKDGRLWWYKAKPEIDLGAGMWLGKTVGHSMPTTLSSDTPWHIACWQRQCEGDPIDTRVLLDAPLLEWLQAVGKGNAAAGVLYCAQSAGYGPDGMWTVPQATESAIRMGYAINPNVVTAAARSGKIAGAERVNYRWQFPQKSFLSWLTVAYAPKATKRRRTNKSRELS